MQLQGWRVSAEVLGLVFWEALDGPVFLNKTIFFSDVNLMFLNKTLHFRAQ